ncbi:unnamed protein product [Prorocentrum cordatum]|uniref:Uncharacterized protein n=1 Tax=Prorocentrum cordatum TaxID=2364126 RepID=A0ABN9TK83_9DINO|nr:unnamed protein product [Polarella glacialis]
MRAQADIDNGLSRILELLAAYVDDVAVASQQLWPKLDAARTPRGAHAVETAGRGRGPGAAAGGGLGEEGEGHQEVKSRMRQMRAFYTSDLENQRDRFRTTLLNSLPELTDSAMAGIMDHLASVNMFETPRTL